MHASLRGALGFAALVLGFYLIFAEQPLLGAGLVAAGVVARSRRLF